ncbi:macrolide ABC transporter ATP-binding protein, partial [Streptococcus pyogenes]
MSHEKKQLMQLSNIVKSYQNGDQVLKVLKGINLT